MFRIVLAECLKIFVVESRYIICSKNCIIYDFVYFWATLFLASQPHVERSICVVSDQAPPKFGSKKLYQKKERLALVLLTKPLLFLTCSKLDFSRSSEKFNFSANYGVAMNCCFRWAISCVGRLQIWRGWILTFLFLDNFVHFRKRLTQRYL